MSSIISTLDDINFYIYVYVGLTELVIGTIGNVLTVIVFGQAPLRTARTASTLIVLAILNTIYLDFAVILRVMAGIRRQNDTTFGSDVLCRFFYFLLNGSASAIVALLAWIAFDRYENTLDTALSIPSLILGICARPEMLENERGAPRKCYTEQH
jgi:hypothetical protein